MEESQAKEEAVMPGDAESAGADKPDSGAVVTRDELSGVLEDMMGRMMTVKQCR